VANFLPRLNWIANVAPIVVAPIVVAQGVLEDTEIATAIVVRAVEAMEIVVDTAAVDVTVAAMGIAIVVRAVAAMETAVVVVVVVVVVALDRGDQWVLVVLHQQVHHVDLLQVHEEMVAALDSAQIGAGKFSNNYVGRLATIMVANLPGTFPLASASFRDILFRLRRLSYYSFSTCLNILKSRGVGANILPRPLEDTEILELTNEKRGKVLCPQRRRCERLL
jgi:hypothetical protein